MHRHQLTSDGPKFDFDYFRLTKAKQAVDICPNTLRAYNKDGLPFYRRGKAVFISRSELAAYIQRGAQ